MLRRFRRQNEFDPNVLSTTIDDLYTSQIGMTEQVQGILRHPEIQHAEQQAVPFVNAILVSHLPVVL